MKTEERITKLEDFIHSQKYLHGLKFCIIEDPEKADSFIIHFVTISHRQRSTLNHKLLALEMSHIRTTADEIIKFENPRVKKYRPRKE